MPGRTVLKLGPATVVASGTLTLYSPLLSSSPLLFSFVPGLQECADELLLVLGERGCDRRLVQV